MKVYFSDICDVISVAKELPAGLTFADNFDIDIVVMDNTIYAPTGRHHVSDQIWLPRMLETIEYCSRPENHPKVVTLADYQ